MARSTSIRTGACGLVGIGLAIIIGCGGGQGATDGGSGAQPDFRDDQFIAGDTTTGSMSLSLSRSSLGVGDTSPFTVSVVNASGKPVSNINVACDSERGVAIVEPSRGFEMTNSSGVMSGVIGCESPGSFQMVCRLSVGANRRKFAQVTCTGDVPAGFQGFPGAAGGGLGGGVQNNDDGDVRIVEAGFNDGGQFDSTDVRSDASIDISQDSDCDNDATTADIEPFFDTYASIKVQNNRSENIRFKFLQYSVTNVDGLGTEFTSKRLAVTRESGSAEAEGDGGSVVLIVPVFKAAGGGKWVGEPTGVGIQITNPSFQTVTFYLVGETASGENVELDAQVTAAFGNYNRCS